MNSNDYFNHLLRSVITHKNNAISQYGKSDIDSPDYISEANDWYDELCDIIKTKTPVYFVKSINVVENSAGKIDDIKFIYFEPNQEVISSTIIISDS